MTKSSTTNKKKPTAKATSTSTSSSKKEAVAASVSSGATSSSQTQTILMSLVLIGVVLVLLFTSFTYYSVSQIDGKVSKLDSFFANNAQGYGDTETAGTPDIGSQGTQAPGAQEVGTPDITNRPVLGEADAPITIVEYSDFECPFCQRFFLETYPQLKSEYIDTGVAKIVYKDFPLNFHQMAKPAAIASKCVYTLSDSETFYEYHDLIFNNQNVLSDSNLRSWALDVGISGEDYDSCIVDPEIEAMVDADMAEGTRFGVSGTPSFVINGQLLVGAQPFSAFEQIIESELE